MNKYFSETGLLSGMCIDIGDTENTSNNDTSPSMNPSRPRKQLPNLIKVTLRPPSKLLVAN